MSDIPALLERFRRGPELLATVLTGIYGEEEDFGTDGKWTIRQIAAHIADSELVTAHRLRQVIAEENPTLTWFDQDAWAKRLDYARRKPKQALESFRRLRAENYDLLKDVAEADYQRTGNHTQRGPMTLRQIVEVYSEHAENHAAQIQQLREEFKKVKGKK